MSAGFVKLYGTILTSSIWLEPHSTLRVWIAMLATADEHGIVSASVGGLAHVSRVRKAECERALETFLAPDEDSRTPDNDGRRIERVDGGWLILNHRKYRDLRTPTQVSEAERKAAWRERQRGNGTVPECPECPPEIQTEAEAEAEVEAYSETTSPTTPREAVSEIAGLLGLSARQLVPWSGILKGMTKGLGSPGMKAVPWPLLLEAAQELAAAGGDVTAHRYKKFVEKVISRGNPAPVRPRSKGKESKNNDALAGWLANQESEITDAEVIPDGE